MSKSKGSAAIAKAPVQDEPKSVETPEEDFEGEAPPLGQPAQASELELLDDDVDLDSGVASDGRPAGGEPAARAKGPSDKEIEEGGGDSMLARYFREMATHTVMGPDEELQTAIDVENAEIEHWVAILSFCPTADAALDTLDGNLPTGDEAIELPQLPEIRKLLKAFQKQHGKLTRVQDKRYREWCTSLGKAIRLADSDRLWIADAEAVVPQARRRAGRRRAARSGPRERRGRRDRPRRRVAAAHRAVGCLRQDGRAHPARRGALAPREEQVREGQPAARRQHRAPV